MGTAATKFRTYLENGDEYAAMQIFQSSPDLQKSFNPNLSYGDSYQHNTPLHFASKHAMKHLLRTFLYDLSGNPNKKNGHNETSLHAVCQMSQTKSLSAHERRTTCVGLILHWKGSMLANGEVEKIDLGSPDDKHNTALHYAASSGLKKCVELLVHNCAPLFAENLDKDTPCDCAEKAGHNDIALYLESKMVFADTADTVNEADFLLTLDANEVYNGLRAQDLQEAKDQLLVETSDMLHVPLFTAEALLRAHEWSREALLENWIKDPIVCCDKAGVQPPSSALQFKSGDGEVVDLGNVATEFQEESLNSPLRTLLLEDGTVCDICLSCIPIEEEPVPMVCEHQFCRSCWEGYLNVKIQAGDAHNIMCPAFGCMRLVPVEMIERLVSPDMVRRYLQFDIKAFVESNPNIKWCPFPGCGRAVKLPASELSLPEPIRIPNWQPPLPTSHAVDCGNGHYFCWECLGEAHAPCGCEKWSEWHQRVTEIKPEERKLLILHPFNVKNTCQATEDAANCLWLVTNSKPCPSCKSPIQKNEGCNHMKCSKCKFDFCWVCLEAWKKHSSATGGYFRCNRFDAVHRAEERQGILVSAAEMKNKQMQELNRFVHYYMRFKNHVENHKLEEPLLKSAKDKMILLAAAAPDSSEGRIAEIETKFVEYAVSELLRARRVLCGSYIYGYYLEDNGYNKNIFEFMQNELEDCTERLSQMVARPYLRTPRTLIIQTAALVKRKRQEFVMAVSKGLIPPETPPTMRRFRRRRLPGLMGIDPVEDEQLSQAIAASLRDLDPNDPWVKDGQGRHTNLASMYDWPDYDSDEEAEMNSALAASILGVCSRKGCSKPRARNLRTGAMHEHCSLRCSKADKLGEREEPPPSYGSDYQMDLLIALEMSRLQMIEDMGRMSSRQENVSDMRNWDTSSTSPPEIVRAVPFLPCLSEPALYVERGSNVASTSEGNIAASCGQRPSQLLLPQDTGVDNVFKDKEEEEEEEQEEEEVAAEGNDCSKEHGLQGHGLQGHVLQGQVLQGHNQEVACRLQELEGPCVELGPQEPRRGRPKGPRRTNADVTVEYFLKSLAGKESYLKNINTEPNPESKAEKELIRFCKTRDCSEQEGPVTESAVEAAAAVANISNTTGVSLVHPKCSCAEHSNQVLWELRGRTPNNGLKRTMEVAPSGVAVGGSSSGEASGFSRNVVDGFGRLKKSTTDGNICMGSMPRKGKIATMTWDMSVSLETLTKKSSTVMKKWRKSEKKWRRHSSQDRDKAHHRRKPDWQFF